MIAQLNPAVRIIPPCDVTGEYWLVDNLLERRRYRLSPAAIAVLVAASRPQQCGELAQWFASADNRRSLGEWASLIESLRTRSLLVEASFVESDPDVCWLNSIRRDWSHFGWEEAAEYHVLSFDYPCIDYSEATAIPIDRARMKRYQSAEPDTCRFKLDYLDAPQIPLPDLREDLLTVTAQTVWGGRTEFAPIESDALARVLALTFGLTGTTVPVTNAAPLLHRSSPSGGARHPSEGYVVVRDIPGIESAWYHVTIQPLGLRKLENLPLDDPSLRQLFPETMDRCRFDARALVIITSVFERNMYRYREPRTFRTVHMDAGHLARTLSIAARSLGLSFGMFYCDNAAKIEQILRIDGMQEGYMVTVAVAGGAEHRARWALAADTQATEATS